MTKLKEVAKIEGPKVQIDPLKKHADPRSGGLGWAQDDTVLGVYFPKMA